MYQKQKIGKLMIYFTSLLFSFLLCQSTAHADDSPVGISAQVDREQMDPGDTFTLSVSVTAKDDSDVSEVTLPAFKTLGMDMINQDDSASAFLRREGGASVGYRTFTYAYILQANKIGRYDLAPIKVTINGHVFQARRIQVQVKPGASAGARRASPSSPQSSHKGQPPSGGMPGFDDEDDADQLFGAIVKRQMDRLRGLQNRGRQGPGGNHEDSDFGPINPNEAFFIRVEVDKKEAFVGEQITASWYLYTRGHVQDIDTLKYPTLKGFWKEDLEVSTHLSFSQDVINGVPYKKALLVSYALFPIKEGSIEIDPYTAKCSILLGIDSFGFGSPKAYSYSKSSLPIKVLVKPLPTAGRPSDFGGAVGQFQVTQRVEDKTVSAHQPFSLKIRYEGRGNAKLIDLANFQVPEGMELYDTQKEAQFFKSGTSFKEFTLLLIPHKEGSVTLPAVSLGVFDPASKKYTVVASQPLTIQVGPPQKGQSGATSQRIGDAKGSFEPKEIPPQIDSDMSVLAFPSAYAQRMTLVVFALGVLLSLLVIARRELGWGQGKIDLNQILQQRLKRLQKKVSQEDWRGVGVEGTNAINVIIGMIAGEGASTEMEKLFVKLSPSLRAEVEGPLRKSLELFQLLSFAPEGAVGKWKEKEQLRKAASDLEAILKRAISLSSAADVLDESAANRKT